MTTTSNTKHLSVTGRQTTRTIALTDRWVAVRQRRPPKVRSPPGAGQAFGAATRLTNHLSATPDQRYPLYPAASVSHGGAFSRLETCAKTIPNRRTPSS